MKAPTKKEFALRRQLKTCDGRLERLIVWRVRSSTWLLG